VEYKLMTMIIHTVQSHDGIALLSCTIISMTALTLTAATDIHGTPARWNQNKCHVNILWLISILWYVPSVIKEHWYYSTVICCLLHYFT